MSGAIDAEGKAVLDRLGVLIRFGELLITRDLTGEESAELLKVARRCGFPRIRRARTGELVSTDSDFEVLDDAELSSLFGAEPFLKSLTPKELDIVRARRLAFRPPPQFNTRQCALGFSFHSSHWWADPQLLFKPVGLLMWGDLSDACVEFVMGTRFEGAASSCGIPARLFTTKESFAEIGRKLEAGEDLGIPRTKPGPAWIDWPTIQPSERVRIGVFRNTELGPRMLSPHDGIELVMWGITLRDY